VANEGGVVPYDEASALADVRAAIEELAGPDDVIAEMIRTAAAAGMGCGVGWEMTGGNFYAVTRQPEDEGRLFTVTGEDPANALKAALRLAIHRRDEIEAGGPGAPFVPPPDAEPDGVQSFTHANRPWQ
jgi:hypothetical protein